jgi:uncharacterized protein with FMN-binding domain
VRIVTALGTTAVAGVVLMASWQAGQRAPATAASGIRIVSKPPHPAPAPSPRPGTAAPRAHASAGQSRRTVTGALVSTPYGQVQVQVSLLGKRITNVTALHLTDSSDTSVQISASAEPTLRSEALSAQSANIDLVSGATYTSEGYKASLQAALDAAR